MPSEDPRSAVAFVAWDPGDRKSCTGTKTSSWPGPDWAGWKVPEFQDVERKEDKKEEMTCFVLRFVSTVFLRFFQQSNRSPNMWIMWYGDKQWWSMMNIHESHWISAILRIFWGYPGKFPHFWPIAAIAMMLLRRRNLAKATMALAESMMNMADDMERVLLGGGISLNILSTHVHKYT